ncbi:MAG: membrane dipeptidase [Oscillospiraceae bacterium]|nr:membrane dipeptidase [Oscillospiraceae bacterium]
MRLPLFDAHCDTLFEMDKGGQSLGRNALHVDLERGLQFSPWAQFFAIYGQDFMTLYRLFQEALAANGDRLALCRTAGQAEAAARAGKCAAFLAVEGAEILDCSLDRLAEAYDLGVRMVTLTWNHENLLSGTNVEGTDRGLTTLGREFVRRCQALGVIVDVSHISEPGFWDAAELLDGPFVASHSNAAALWPHSRNLTDGQFGAIVRAGGVAGINLYSAFLGEDPDLDCVIAHMEHFLALGGAKSVALGADLDGCDALPRGISGVEDLHKLGERMLQRNYTEALVLDIFYNNLMRVVSDICGI